MSSSEQNSFEYQTVANNLNLTETGGADADADADDCESGESSLRSEYGDRQDSTSSNGHDLANKNSAKPMDESSVTSSIQHQQNDIQHVIEKEMRATSSMSEYNSRFELNEYRNGAVDLSNGSDGRSLTSEPLAFNRTGEVSKKHEETKLIIDPGVIDGADKYNPGITDTVDLKFTNSKLLCMPPSLTPKELVQELAQELAQCQSEKKRMEEKFQSEKKRMEEEFQSEKKELKEKVAVLEQAQQHLQEENVKLINDLKEKDAMMDQIEEARAEAVKQQERKDQQLCETKADLIETQRSREKLVKQIAQITKQKNKAIKQQKSNARKCNEAMKDRKMAIRQQGKFLRERDHAVKERDEAIKKFERMSEGCLQITKDITNTLQKEPQSQWSVPQLSTDHDKNHDYLSSCAEEIQGQSDAVCKDTHHQNGLHQGQILNCSEDASWPFPDANNEKSGYGYHIVCQATGSSCLEDQKVEYESTMVVVVGGYHDSKECCSSLPVDGHTDEQCNKEVTVRGNPVQRVTDAKAVLPESNCQGRLPHILSKISWNIPPIRGDADVAGRRTHPQDQSNMSYWKLDNGDVIEDPGG